MTINEEEMDGKITCAEDKPEEIAILAMKYSTDKTEIRKIAIEHNALLPWSDEKVRELYNLGYTDRQLCNAFGFTNFVVIQWRQKNKLPPHKQKLTTTHREYTGRQSRIDSEAAMKLYKEGLSDGKIAEKLSMSSNAVWNWRKKNNLSPNFQHTKSDKPVHKKSESVNEPPKTVAETPETVTKQPDICNCCKCEIPTTHGVRMCVTADIAGEKYKLCPDCAKSFVWATARL